jgi:signal transduction histidine kinase
MVKTVMRNLLMNAIKFTERGGRITVTAEQNDEMTEISVKDTGVGIEEENQQKLFNLESNFSTEGTARESGFGLGLLVSKEFVEMNKGKISFTSTYGKGSTFKFTLPKE